MRKTIDCDQTQSTTLIDTEPAEQATIWTRSVAENGKPTESRTPMNLYPLENALRIPFLTFYGRHRDLDHLLDITPKATTALLSAICKNWDGNTTTQVGYGDAQVLAEMPGGATRRMYDDDGRSAEVWWLLRKTAQTILDNLDFEQHLTPPRREALERVIAGPLDVDMKHWEQPKDITRSIDKYNSSAYNPFSHTAFTLNDGRTVIQTSIRSGGFKFHLDIAQHLEAKRNTVLRDYRTGPQQPRKANVYGLLIRSGENLYVGLDRNGKHQNSDAIGFAEYPEGYFQALCAIAKLMRLKMLSSTRNESFGEGSYKFSLRMAALFSHAQDDHKKGKLVIPNFRVSEFIADMLISATVSHELTARAMSIYSFRDTILEDAKRVRNFKENLVKFDPKNPFHVMRFIQDIDPTNIFR